MEGDKKIVDFEKYCKDCEFEKVSASNVPCNDCLTIPARADSRKPEYFKEKKKTK